MVCANHPSYYKYTRLHFTNTLAQLCTMKRVHFVRQVPPHPRSRTRANPRMLAPRENARLTHALRPRVHAHVTTHAPRAPTRGIYHTRIHSHARTHARLHTRTRTHSHHTSPCTYNRTAVHARWTPHGDDTGTVRTTRNASADAQRNATQRTRSKKRTHHVDRTTHTPFHR